MVANVVNDYGVKLPESALMWNLPDFDKHECIHMVHDEATGLRAIIALHSTYLGPAAGGTRFWHYTDPAHAITDALRLSRGMSYKNAMADLPMGGGKAVILAGNDGRKTPEMLAAFGNAVNDMGGRYVTAEDVGMTDADMVALSQKTSFVSGLPTDNANNAGGDPGPFTAQGVYLGVKAAVAEGLKTDDLRGVRIAIQGVGSVGGKLARLLAADGAKLFLADVVHDRVAALAEELGAEHVGLDDIMQVEADVFSPNALGAILDDRSLETLSAKVIAGGANNQLAEARHASVLHTRGITYAPDYVINAGGIISVAREYLGQRDGVHCSVDSVMAEVSKIPARLHEIWAQSRTDNVPAANVADAMAQAKIGRI
ncbi:Leu/Phe/Val dehydrogenase [Parasphingorhabdus sp. DH2-15]|uniref:Leu/Phe/Val dehydrogenase n=1 Tax=Parasphingorhabdus sp. DH2-15 TaxID=3444112 RepID=UPI003F6877E8